MLQDLGIILPQKIYKFLACFFCIKILTRILKISYYLTKPKKIEKDLGKILLKYLGVKNLIKDLSNILQPSRKKLLFQEKNKDLGRFLPNIHDHRLGKN
jgi:hypothetical protein